MSVYTKLNNARLQFHGMKLEKSGHNKFAGYKYFELADFVIPALEVFNDNGLCSIVSFSANEATMRIIDTDDNSEIVISSPMSTAALKGCHEVQNLGAVQTYIRRYLWIAALEIVEHDAVDSSDAPEAVKQPQINVEQEIAALDMLDTTDALKNAWKALSERCKKAGDTEAFNTLKEFVTAKVNQIKGEQA